MFTKAAIQHLRLRFSLLLMPVFWLGIWGFSLMNWDLSLPSIPNAENTFLGIGPFVFFVWGIMFISLHLFIYPGSNAYNSFQDRDIGSIGDVKNPLPIDKSVFNVSVLFTVIGLILSVFAGFHSFSYFPTSPLFNCLWRGLIFFLFMLTYVLFSTLYSWRKVRLKKYPIIGFFIIFIFQGAWIIYAVNSFFSSSFISFDGLHILALAASFLFGGGYPITQIYQHKQDKEDGVKTISMLLGIKGTLIFSGFMNAIGMALLFYVLYSTQQSYLIVVYLICMIPVLVKFNIWAISVFKDKSNANYKNVMQMTWISGICNNIAFISFILLPSFVNLTFYF